MPASISIASVPPNIARAGSTFETGLYRVRQLTFRFFDHCQTVAEEEDTAEEDTVARATVASLAATEVSPATADSPVVTAASPVTVDRPVATVDSRPVATVVPTRTAPRVEPDMADSRTADSRATRVELLPVVTPRVARAVPATKPFVSLSVSIPNCMS